MDVAEEPVIKNNFYDIVNREFRIEMYALKSVISTDAVFLINGRRSVLGDSCGTPAVPHANWGGDFEVSNTITLS